MAAYPGEWTFVLAPILAAAIGPSVVVAAPAPAPGVDCDAASDVYREEQPKEIVLERTRVRVKRRRLISRNSPVVKVARRAPLPQYTTIVAEEDDSTDSESGESSDDSTISEEDSEPKTTPSSTPTPTPRAGGLDGAPIEFVPASRAPVATMTRADGTVVRVTASGISFGESTSTPGISTPAVEALEANAPSRVMSAEVEHFLIAAAAIAGVVFIVLGGLLYLRRNRELRERMLNKVFPGRYQQYPDEKAPSETGNRSDFSFGLFGRIIGAKTETSRDSIVTPPPAAFAIDDNRTERRYSRQNLVRESLLRARMPSPVMRQQSLRSESGDYTAYATPPPIYSGHGFSSPQEKQGAVQPPSRPVTDIYVPDGIQYSNNIGNASQNTRPISPVTPINTTPRAALPPVPDTPRTEISTDSEPPRFRGVNSWVSNQAHRLERNNSGGASGRFPVRPSNNMVATAMLSPTAAAHKRQNSGPVGRFPRASGMPGLRDSGPGTPPAFRQHPGEKVEVGMHQRVLSADLDREI